MTNKTEKFSPGWSRDPVTHRKIYFPPVPQKVEVKNVKDPKPVK